MIGSRNPHPRGKPHRRCIFCGKGGVAGNPMSQEHLWSDWMHPILPKFENPIKDLGYMALHTTARTALRTFRSLQGHVYGETFKVVCRNCNNGWMGTIESTAKPFLIPM